MCTPLGTYKKAIRTGLVLYVAPRAVGNIQSSSGKETAVPMPRKKVRRDNRGFVIEGLLMVYLRRRAASGTAPSERSHRSKSKIDSRCDKRLEKSGPGPVDRTARCRVPTQTSASSPPDIAQRLHAAT